MEQFKETAIRLCAACGESVGSLNRAAERARRDYQGARRETELQAIEKSRGATQQKYAQLLAEAEDAAKVRIQGETISGQDLTADFALLDAVPTQTHDARMDGVVTPKHTIVTREETT